MNMIKKLLGFFALAGVSIYYTVSLSMGIAQNSRASVAVLIAFLVVVGLYESFSDSLRTGKNE